MPLSAPRSQLLLPFFLVAVVGCQDLSPPTQPVGPRPHFAQGDGGVYTVNVLTDPGDGICDDQECTLREAITTAWGSATLTRIVFADGLEGDITLSAGSLLLIDMFAVIDGDGRIGVDAGNGSRVMQMQRFTPSPDDPSVTLTGMRITNGFIDGFGGGITAVGAGLDLILDNVAVTGNLALDNGGGISIALDATVTIRNSTISGNSARSSGGGLYVASGSSLTLINTTVDGNGADDEGGGIFNEGDLVVTASTISSNNSDDSQGGGIYNALGSNATLTLATVSGNTSESSGAGITNLGALSVRSSTVVRNSGSLGGSAGIFNAGIASAQVANSIIGGNSGAGDCSSSIVSHGYNLTTDQGIGGCGFSEPGDVEIALDQFFVEVLDENLNDNAGPTKTHALIVRGRAVDAGYCPGETTDQRGLARPVDDVVMTNALDGCDIGAYELQGPVTPIADLMISQTVNKTSVKQGDLLTYFIRVQNLGPETAPNGVVTNLLSSGVTFVEARAAKGNFTAPPNGETGTVTWYLGDLLDQANEVAEIEVTVLVKGKTTITNSASVAADVVDPNEANNSASIMVSVGAGGSGKGGKQK